MAAYIPMSSPRQPFAALDSPRLRNLSNIKNRQNALPTILSSPVKRRYSPTTTNEDDSENVDPCLFDSPSKRVKNIDGSYLSGSTKSDNTPIKKSHFILTDSVPSPKAFQTPVRLPGTPSSRLNKSALGLRKSGLSSTTLATPAGRSPKHKSLGSLSKRRTSSPFTRIDPPTSLRDVGPLSIDAALSGTIPTYAPKPRTGPLQEVNLPSLNDRTMKASWQFEIHEDTLEDTLTNIMEFSTGVLDISDDESRQREKNDRGKENIPPTVGSEMPAMGTDSTSTPTSAREPGNKSRKSREARQSSLYYRAPLGDLFPADFYGEDLNAASFVIVTSSPAEKSILSREFKEPSYATPARPRINPFAVIKDERKEFLQKREEQGNWPSSAPTFSGFGKKDEEIVIWESGSADEAEIEEEKSNSSGSEAGVFSMDMESERENTVLGRVNPLKRKCEMDDPSA